MCPCTCSGFFASCSSRSLGHLCGEALREVKHEEMTGWLGLETFGSPIEGGIATHQKVV